MGAELLKVRAAYGLSQADLAQRIGWSQSAVARAELGRRALTRADLEGIVAALERKRRELLAEVGL
jgi:transcriptional regulator with XRE-family HTH domain